MKDEREFCYYEGAKFPFDPEGNLAEIEDCKRAGYVIVYQDAFDVKGAPGLFIRLERSEQRNLSNLCKSSFA